MLTICMIICVVGVIAATTVFPDHLKDALKRGESITFQKKRYGPRDLPMLLSKYPSQDGAGADAAGSSEEFEQLRARNEELEKELKDTADAYVKVDDELKSVRDSLDKAEAEIKALKQAFEEERDPEVEALLAEIAPGDAKKLDNFTVDQLRALGKFKKIEGAEEMTKGAIVEALIKGAE